MQNFTEHNAIIWGISFDTPEENAAFARKFDFPFPLLSDPDMKIGMAYHAAGSSDEEYAKRITYVIDPDGKIVLAYPAVDVQVHPAQVLADLEGC